MAITLTPVLTARWDTERSWTLDAYREAGGYDALRTALAMDPADVVAAVKSSGLRGRGGAGFPTGMKWGFLPAPDGGPRYLVVNADESEPGTCKDIPLLLADPHLLVEGAIITAYAIGCHHAFVYLRGEVLHVYRRLLAAVQQANDAGLLGSDVLGSGYDLELTVHAGAGAYICGEETALLDSLEGLRGQPRLKPPFPAVAGLYGRPTVVNNVESIASIPSIISGGADWFRSMGTEKSTGFGLFSLSGHVTRPGQYEAPLGITLRQAAGDGRWRAQRPHPEVLDPRWLLDPVVHGRAPGRATGLRVGGDGGLDARHPRAADLRRHHLRGARDHPLAGVLRPRVLRQVHPLPGGHPLDEADPGPDRARSGHHGGPGHPARRVRQHPGQGLLPPR